jgi:hypothetical protein
LGFAFTGPSGSRLTLAWLYPASVVFTSGVLNVLKILNEDMDEETLREIFKECLRDAPDTTDKDKARGGLFTRLFKRRGGGSAFGGAEATEEELAQAAHYIVERFGAVPDDDDDDDDDDLAGPVRAARVSAVLLRLHVYVVVCHPGWWNLD